MPRESSERPGSAPARSGPPSARSVLLFFGGTALLLASASPLWIRGMGYVAEEIAACEQILGGSQVAWPRNGAASLLLELPLLAIGRLIARTPAGAETVVSMAPVLATAGIAALLYVWASRLSKSRAWGLAIAAGATFATMLWPYAYMGMEPLQSLLLLAAGWCALERPPGVPSWSRSVAFGALAGLALSSKSIGFLLVPAALFLLWRLFGPTIAAAWTRAVGAVALAAAIYGANAATRLTFWRKLGGAAAYGRDWLVQDPLAPLLHAAALLVSPNKGLLVFAPLALLGVMALPEACRRNRPVAAFALLTLGGVLAGISALGIWSDETWGPRYLHVAVAPLLLAFASTRAGRPLRLRGEAPFAAAAGAGFLVSLLGILFYYGSLSHVANRTTTLTLESLQGDLTWNHPRFNARLLRVWLTGAGNGVARERVWNFDDPQRPLEWKAVDLSTLATPQPRVLRPSENQTQRRLRWACVVAALAGMVLLERAMRSPRAVRAPSRRLAASGGYDPGPTS